MDREKRQINCRGGGRTGWDVRDAVVVSKKRGQAGILVPLSHCKKNLSGYITTVLRSSQDDSNLTTRSNPVTSIFVINKHIAPRRKMINNINISSRQILPLFVCLLTLALSWHDCLADESKALRFYKGSEPVIADSKHPALRNGINGVIVKHRSGYSIGFSTVVCQSVWVAYRLTVQDVAMCDENKFNLDREGKKPHRDPDEISKYFVRGEWPGGTYDRGHLAPCGDMKYSQKAFEDSFNQSIFCPQKKYQNEVGEWWKWEKELHDDLSLNPAINPEGPQAECIYIITGPIYSASKIKKYLNEKKYNGQALMIPDSFYKISIMNNVMTCKVFPQEGGVQVVSLWKIQQLTGLEFFPGVQNLPYMRE